MTKPGEARKFFNETVLAYDGDECLIWPYATNGNGYAQIFGEGKVWVVSRLLCEEEHGPPPSPDFDAAHSCGRGHHACVTKKHMRWATRAQNLADRNIHGTSPRGRKTGRSKLTDDDRAEIKRLRGLMPLSEIGARFSIAPSTVSKIHTGSWRY